MVTKSLTNSTDFLSQNITNMALTKAHNSGLPMKIKANMMNNSAGDTKRAERLQAQIHSSG
jgi:hypothetical protein